MQLGGAALGGAAGVATGAALGNKAGTPGAAGTNQNAPLDPGVTRIGSDPRDVNNGQSAAQIAAANPQGNVFRQDARTAATNPREPLFTATPLPVPSLLKVLPAAGLQPFHVSR